MLVGWSERSDRAAAKILELQRRFSDAQYGNSCWSAISRTDVRGDLDLVPPVSASLVEDDCVVVTGVRGL
jgi:hypothetical protein